MNCDYNPLKKQYLRCLDYIFRCDYPNEFPSIIQTVIQSISVFEDQKLLTGLQVLHVLFKSIDFNGKEYKIKRQLSNEIALQTFDILGNVMNNIMNIINTEQTNAHKKEVSEYFLNHQKLDQWMTIFKTLIDQPLSTEITQFTEDTEKIEENEQKIEWKIKSICSFITFKLFYTYQKSWLLANRMVELSDLLYQKYAIGFLESHLKILYSKPTQFISRKTFMFSAQFVALCLKHTPTLDLLIPQIEKLLVEVLVKSCLLSQKEYIMLNDDPVEFIRYTEQSHEEETLKIC
ncbi:importin 8 [Stylonychia lemnae]|uniref:Importin 8 n=1 Tax=Stylonychia lemnae TaxID=5949 RepID=A0A078B0T6_STYLE|nr:importin 8 [Stylonychia lemnae]|eukprot:CDW87901.1 importin 8 [Stylonychia lemnae]